MFISKNYLSDQTRKRLYTFFTICDNKQEKYTGFPKTVRYYSEGKDYIEIPRFGLYHFNQKYDTECKNIDDFTISTDPVTIHKSKLENTIDLKPYQKEIKKNVISYLNDYSGCLLKLNAGLGKSFIAASLIKNVGMKTLIVVHRSNLIGQWKKVLSAYTKLNIGEYHGGKKEDGDVVVALINSLKDNYETSGGIRRLIKREFIMNNRPTSAEEFFSSFGLVILDEVHKYSSTSKVSMSFLKQIQVNVQFILGMSATPFNNEFDYSLPWRVGPLYDASKDLETTDDSLFDLRVKAIHYYGPEEYTRHIINQRGFSDLSAIVNQTCEDEERKKLIISILMKEIRDPTKYIFVFSTRRKYLQELMSMFINEMSSQQNNDIKFDINEISELTQEREDELAESIPLDDESSENIDANEAEIDLFDAIPDPYIVRQSGEEKVGYQSSLEDVHSYKLIGGGSNKASEYMINEAEKNARVIFTTYQYMNTGKSIVKMNTMILANSIKSGIEQTVGRITRLGSDTNIPRNIYDIIDEYTIEKHQFYERKLFYDSKSAVIEHFIYNPVDKNVKSRFKKWTF